MAKPLSPFWSGPTASLLIQHSHRLSFRVFLLVILNLDFLSKFRMVNPVRSLTALAIGRVSFPVCLLH